LRTGLSVIHDIGKPDKFNLRLNSVSTNRPV
jgi:hypothetical protein